MAKLGYTWYPKDWGNSESVFELNLAERGLYRELIDLAMLNDNKTEIKKDVWSRKFAVENNELVDILHKLNHLKLIEFIDNTLFIPSCESRLNFSRGGKNSKPTSKGISNLKNQLSEPISEPISEQIEKKRNIKEEEKNNIENRSLIFKNSLLPFKTKYGIDILKNFYGYWTEPNKSNTKMRFELEKTWSIERRLETWSNRQKDFAIKQPKIKEDRL